MASLAVCMGNTRSRVALQCNLQKQRLCLNNSPRTPSATRKYSTRSNLFVNGKSQSYPSSNHNRLGVPTNPRTIWLRQYATPSSTSETNSTRELNNEPDGGSSDLDEAVSYVKQNQRKTPWQREGSQIPPVKRERDASAMTKGKLS